MAVDASSTEGLIHSSLEVVPSHAFQELISQLDVQTRIYDIPMAAFEMFDERHILEGRLSRYVPDTFVVNVTGMSTEISGSVFGFGISPINAAAYVNLIYNVGGSIKEIEFVLMPFHVIGTKSVKSVNVSYNPSQNRFRGMNLNTPHAQVMLNAFTSGDLSNHIFKVVENFFPPRSSRSHTSKRVS